MSSSYENLVNYYNEHREKPWTEWLQFYETFPKPGKQGLVGLLKSNKGHKYVFKISQYLNYLVHHESQVMKSLNSLSPFCPHFCKGVGTIECEVNPESRKSGNPFTKAKLTVVKEVMLCEYLENTTKLYNIIRADVKEDALYATIKQVLLAIAFAQRSQNFTHYDLHSNNIMMKKCDPNVVFLYVLDEENQFCVPTHGLYPVIIDFGFSYSKSMEDGPMWPSMGHTDVGFTSNQFDPIADPKLFLVTVSGEIKEKRKSKKSKRFRRVVRNIFGKLNIDWINGWDKGKKSASDCVSELIGEYNQTSELFEEYEHYCLDMVQSLVILPLQEQNYSNIHISYSTFLAEWVKIENQISSYFYNLYILKGVVDAARLVTAAYLDPETRENSVIDFQRYVGERIDSVVKFCRTTGLDFEKMLCSLLLMARGMEGILFDVMFAKTISKEKEYAKMPLKSVEQIYAAVEANVNDSYVYTDKTSVIILDSLNKTTNIYEIPAHVLDTINDLNPIARGTYIYDLYKS